MNTEESRVEAVQPFGQVPAALIMDGELTAGARILCAYLWTYANPHTKGFVWPSQARMVTDLGVTRRSILRWIDELVKRGWLTRQKRIDTDPEWKGNPVACIYQLMQSCHRDTSVTHDRDERVTMTVTPESPEHTREHTTLTDVVDFEVSTPTALELYASKNPLIKNPKGWAIAMQKKGVTLEQVLSEKVNGRAAKKRGVDPDSVEATSRYLVGVEL